MATTTTTLISAKHVVDTTLNYYLEPANGETDIMYLASVGERRRKHNPVPVQIEDIRGRETDFTLDRHGFQLVKAPSVEKEFDDDARIKDVYYSECIELLKKVTGATRVAPMGHIVRRKSWEEALEEEKHLPDSHSVIAPTTARFVHVDQSYRGSQVRLEHYMPNESEKLSSSRWAIINVWRPISTIERDNLCMCDARSIPEEDLREQLGKFPKPDEASNDDSQESKKAYINKKDNFSWSVVAPTKAGSHKWYYASRLTADEVLLLKIFDSKNDGTAKRSPHSSFQASTDSGPARQSLEVRLLVFWEDQTAE